MHYVSEQKYRLVLTVYTPNKKKTTWLSKNRREDSRFDLFSFYRYTKQQFKRRPHTKADHALKQKKNKANSPAKGKTRHTTKT